MSFTYSILIAASGLFLGMLLCFEIGRRFGIARLAHDPEGLAKGSGPVEAAVFGLLGLLLAFTFSGAASRFEDRRHLIERETNAIETAYLRVDLLPSDTQPEVRQLFRRYIDARLTSYRNVEDTTATEASLSEASAVQDHIWEKSVAASRRPEAPLQAALLMLPALNEMAGLSLISALLVG